MVKNYLKTCMRITTIILAIQTFTATLLIAGVGTAQSINVEVSKANVTTVFKAIEKQTEVKFAYSEAAISDLDQITLSIKNKSLQEALRLLEKQLPLQFKRNGNLIGVNRIEKKSVIPVMKKQAPPDKVIPPKKITGQVTNENDQPLTGVTISVKGSTISTTTNNEGEYVIEVPDENAVLIFSYIGFVTQESIVINQTIINLSLKESVGQLDQVMVQGYGTTTQRLSTGNVSKVTAETITSQPVTNPLQALSGRVAGVQITELNGLPGASMSVQIRGRNSIGASNNPLYIVDGVPFSAEPIGSTQTAGFVYTSPLNSISPNDIESISILKDADATAIYGSRAANGVILITTKKGVGGKTKLDVTFDRGFSKAARTVKPLSTLEYLQLRKDAYANSGITPTATEAPDLFNWGAAVDNNIQDWFIGSAAQLYNAGLSFSGGTNQTKFLISGNFNEQSTLFSGSDRYRRGNLHAKIDHTSANQKLKVSFSAIYGSDNNSIQGSNNSDVISVAQLPPNYPLYAADGNYNWVAGKTNYLALSQAGWKSATDNLNGNVLTSYKIVEGIELKANIGYNKIQSETMMPQPAVSKDPSSATPLGSNSFGNTNLRSFLFEPQVVFSKNLGPGKLTALVGSTIQSRTTTSTGITVSNYYNDLLIETFGAGTITYTNKLTTEYNYLSAFVRLTYNLDDRFIFNGTFRRDGSTRFGPGKQFGNFGSLGAAWLISNEKFIKNKFEWLSFAKVRGSYGSTGSDGIGDYGYLSLYLPGSDYGTMKVINPSQIANTDYQWEVTKKLEFALDLGFWRNKLLLSSAWYRNRSGNQLVTYPLATTTGFSGYTANIPALVQNSGCEFEINSKNIDSKNFSWTTSANLTIPKNILVDFPKIETTGYANTLVVGRSLNSYLGYHFLGIDSQTGITKIEDINNNGTITSNSAYNNAGGDKVYVGTTDAKWFAGLGNTFTYKSFSLDIFLQYTKQEGYNLYYGFNGFSNFGGMYNGWDSYLDYWKSPGSESKLPKPFAQTNVSTTNFAESDQAFSDASFLRLKSISLRYQLPERLLTAAKISRIEVFAQGQNIFTITDFNGYDPENASVGGTTIPLLKTFTFGLRASI